MSTPGDGPAIAELEPRAPRTVQRVDLVVAIASTGIALAFLLIALSTRLESSAGWSVALFWTAPVACVVALAVLWFSGRLFEDPMLRWFAAGLAIALPPMVLQFMGFPLVAADGGPLGTSGSSSAVLYLLFHLGPALAALAAVARVPLRFKPAAIVVGVLLSVAVALDWVPLPEMIRPEDASYTPLLLALEWALAAVLLVAGVLWIRAVGRAPSGLHAWVGVFLLIATYDVVFNALGAARFTPIWWASLMLRVSSFAVLAGGCLAWLLASLRSSERYGEQEIARREGQLGVAFGLNRRLLQVSDYLSSGVSLDEVCRRVVEVARAGTGFSRVGLRLVGASTPAGDADPICAALLDRASAARDGSDEVLLLTGAERVREFVGAGETYGAQAAAVVPLRSVEGVVAHVALWTPTEHHWAAEDSLFLSGLATQAGQAVTRALAYESMVNAANTLQESLLPARLPDIADLRLLTAYRAVTAGSSVGGDWFDCIRVDDRRIALVIGDVMGKGFKAAASMGQVRTALRAATAYDPRPAAVLSSLDSDVLELEDDEIITLLYALLDLDTGRLGVARAGHAPLLVARPDGTVEVLEDGGSPPIGWHEERREECWTTVERGSALVLYTDGLVENRRSSLDDGIGTLRETVGRLHRGSGTEPGGWAAWLDTIQARDTWQDDVAVLIGLYTPEPPGTPETD